MADKLEIRKIFEELDQLEVQNKLSADELLNSSEELVTMVEEDQLKEDVIPQEPSQESKDLFSDIMKDEPEDLFSNITEDKPEDLFSDITEDKPEETTVLDFSENEEYEVEEAYIPEQAYIPEESIEAVSEFAFAGETPELEQTKEAKQIASHLTGIRNFGERYKNWLLAAFAAFVIALVGLAGIFNHYMAYEYSYNGKLLGVVKDKEDVLRITDLVQEALTEDRNMDVIIDKKKDISFERVAVFGNDTHIDTSDEVLKRMTYVGDINVRAYTISVNGKNAAVVSSKKAAENVLSGLKEDYTAKEDNSVVEDADFLEEIKIKPVNTDLQRLQKEETAKESLKAGSRVEKTHIVSADETLADLAEKYNMSEDELLRLNPTADPTQLVVGSTIKYMEEAPVVTLKTVEFVTYTEDIDYNIIEKKSKKIYKGEEEVKKKGEKGKKTITARIEKTNGKEESKKIIVETINKEPVEEEVVVGSKKRPVTIGDGKFIYPLENYRLSSKFAWRWGRQHKGIDLACPMHSKVVAGDGGTVTFAGYKGSLGNVVMIDHQNGMESWYAHNDSLTVKAGDKVYQGQQIALSGNTGRSTGPHVHFQINIDGEAVDPLKYVEDK